MREEVKALGEKWSWGDEELRYAGIESPLKVKERLVSEGRYRPAVSQACVRGNRVRKDTDLLKDGRTIKDLFDEEGESVVSLAGDVLMEVPLMWRARRARGQGLFNVDANEEDGRSGATRYMTEEDISKVEEELEALAKDIVETSLERQTQTSMETAVYAAIGRQFDWGMDRNNVEENGVKAVVGIQHTNKMKQLLRNVVTELSELQAEKFEDIDLMLEGYDSFLKFSTKEKASMQVDEHDIYKA